jgi:hypothetical protein
VELVLDRFCIVQVINIYSLVLILLNYNFLLVVQVNVLYYFIGNFLYQEIRMVKLI